MDGVKVAVTGAHVDCAVSSERRRGVYGAASGERPLLAAVGVEGIEAGVLRAHVTGAFGSDGWRRFHHAVGREPPLLGE